MGEKETGCYLGAGFLFVQPRWSNNPAYTTLTLATGGAPFSATATDLDYDAAFSPRVWAGFVSEYGLGVRGRYWYFRESSDPLIVRAPDLNSSAVLSAAPLNGIGGIDGVATARVTSLLGLHQADLEVTQGVRAGNWSLVAAGGARYANLEQEYGWAEFGEEANSIVQSRIDFDGVGPTVALDARRGLGGSGLSVYSNLRASVLFGTYRQNVAQLTVEGTPTATAAIDQEHVIPMLDAEAGLEYSKQVGRATVFLQAGAFAQVWFNAGNSSNSNPFPGSLPQGPFPFSYEANALSFNDLAFIGLSVSAGIRY